MMRSPPQPQQTPQRDPQLEAIQAQAQQDKAAAIQDRVSKETMSLLRRYGARAALSGAAVQPPLAMGA